jgi:condensin-2 complex subunit H2
MPSQGGDEILNEVQSRYGYLLKPIRDLFKNWEINIAAELEEYLNEVKFDNLLILLSYIRACLI